MWLPAVRTEVAEAMVAPSLVRFERMRELKPADVDVLPDGTRRLPAVRTDADVVSEAVVVSPLKRIGRMWEARRSCRVNMPAEVEAGKDVDLADGGVHPSDEGVGLSDKGAELA